MYVISLFPVQMLGTGMLRTKFNVLVG
jgi:hypothetical protein